MGNVTAVSLRKREGNCTEPGPTTCGGVNTRYLDEVGPIPAVILPSGPYCLEKKFVSKNPNIKVNKKASTLLPKTPPPPSTLPPPNPHLPMLPPSMHPQMGPTYGAMAGPPNMAPGYFYGPPMFPRLQMPFQPRLSQGSYQQMQPELSPTGAYPFMSDQKKCEDQRKRSRTEIFEELSRVLIQKRQEDEVLQRVAQEIVDSNQKQLMDDGYAQYTPPTQPPSPPPSPPPKVCKTVVKPIICCRCKRKSPQKKSIKAICNMKKNLNDLMKKNYMLTLENHLLYEMVIKHKLEKEAAGLKPLNLEWSNAPQETYPPLYSEPQPPSLFSQRRSKNRGRSLPPNKSQNMKYYHTGNPYNQSFPKESQLKEYQNSDYRNMDPNVGRQEYDQCINPYDLSQRIEELCASLYRANNKEEPQKLKQTNGANNGLRKPADITTATATAATAAAAAEETDNCLYVLEKEPTLNGLPCYRVSHKKTIDSSQGQNRHVVDQEGTEPSSKNNQKFKICLNPFTYSTTRAYNVNTTEKMYSCDDKCYIIQKSARQPENSEKQKSARAVTSAPDLPNNDLPTDQTYLDKNPQESKRDSTDCTSLKMHPNLTKKIENDESFCICQSVPCKSESCSSLIKNIASLIKSVKGENAQTQPKQQSELRQDNGQTNPQRQGLSVDACKALAQSLLLSKFSHDSPKFSTLPHQNILLNSFDLYDPTSPLTDMDYEHSAMTKLGSTLPQFKRTIDYCNFDYEIDHCMAKNPNWIQNEENKCRNVCRKKIENYIKKKGKGLGKTSRYQSFPCPSNDDTPLCADIDFLSSPSCGYYCVESDEDEIKQQEEPKYRPTSVQSVQTDPISSLEPLNEKRHSSKYYEYPENKPPSHYQLPYEDYGVKEKPEKFQSQYKKASQRQSSLSSPFQARILSNTELTAQNTKANRISAIQFTDESTVPSQVENEPTSPEVPSEQLPKPIPETPPKKKRSFFGRKKRKTSK